METPFAMYDALTSIDVPPEKVRSVVRSMEHDMAQFATVAQFSAFDQHSAANFGLLRNEMAGLHRDVAGLREEVDRRFEQVDRRFEQVDRRFDQMEQQMRQMLQRVEQRLIVRLGSFLAVCTAVLATLMTLLRA